MKVFISYFILLWPGILLMLLPRSVYWGAVCSFAIILVIISFGLIGALVGLILRPQRFKRGTLIELMRIGLFQVYSISLILIAGVGILKQEVSFPINIDSSEKIEFYNPIQIEARLVSDPILSGQRYRCRLRLQKMEVQLPGVVEGWGSAKGEVQSYLKWETKCALKSQVLEPHFLERGDIIKGSLSKIDFQGWKVDILSVDSSQKDFRDRMYNRLRGKLKDWAEFAGDPGGLVIALLDGDRSFVDEGVRRGYQKAGVSHLLALSGMHLGVISSCLMFLLSPFMGKLWSWIVVAIVSWLYVWFAGASPSLVRAAWMALLLLGIRWKGGVNSMKWVLSASFSLSLALQPEELHSPSLILSYLALAGLLWLQPLFSRALEILRPRKLMRAFSAVYAAQVATVGWSFPNFGTFATGGLFASLLLTPLTFAIMGVGAFSLFSWLFGLEWLSFISLKLLYPIYWLNEKLLIFFGNWPILKDWETILLYFLPLILLLIVYFVVEYRYVRKRNFNSQSRSIQFCERLEKSIRRKWTDHAKKIRSKFFAQSIGKRENC